MASGEWLVVSCGLRGSGCEVKAPFGQIKSRDEFSSVSGEDNY